MKNKSDKYSLKSSGDPFKHTHGALTSSSRRVTPGNFCLNILKDYDLLYTTPCITLESTILKSVCVYAGKP